ncbi:MAG: VCBS repeat-containing protein [Bacteroidota bacterium]
MMKRLLFFVFLSVFKIAMAQRPLPVFSQQIIDKTVQFNSHKPKVFARFSDDAYNDIGSLDNTGFKIYRYAENWKPYIIFNPGPSQGFEDAQAADINNDGKNDIVIGGWSNKTLWAENPAGHGKNPYTTSWKIHIVDSTRFSHEVCVADLNSDHKPDIITTSGVYLQGATPAQWTFVDIGRSGQGTFAINMLNSNDGFSDVIALYKSGTKNQIAWFENPGHTGKTPLTDKWVVHIIDPNPGGDKCNFEMTTMAFTAGDINHDGRSDLVCASQGEGPGAGDDNRQVGDGLVWYEAPPDARNGNWQKHIIDATIGWVHASSIQLADFDGDGHLDINYAQQDQSKQRKGGSGAKQQLAIFFNTHGKGLNWKKEVLIQYPGTGAGGFNSKVGIVGTDKQPGIVTSLHGYFHDANPLLLWRIK